MINSLTNRKHSLIPFVFTFLLAFNGGFGDASSFLLLGVFTGHLTGNTVITMMSLVQGNYLMVVSTGIALGGFVMGTLIGTFWRKSLVDQHRVYLPMVLQALLMLIAAVLIHYFGISSLVMYSLIILLTIALGIQNGMYTKVLSVGIHSSYITGASTNVIDTVLFINKSNAAQVLKRNLLFATIAGFTVGALIGSLVSYYGGHYAFFILAILTAMLAILCWRQHSLIFTNAQ